jgi:predicted metallo-beta-lactamase superfamily hydrolase
VPETCDEIDRELAKVGVCPLDIEAILKSYRIEATKHMHYAIHEIFCKATATQIYNARAAIQKQTFALRLALVKKIESEITAEGREVAPNHYQHWIKHIGIANRAQS